MLVCKCGHTVAAHDYDSQGIHGCCRCRCQKFEADSYRQMIRKLLVTLQIAYLLAFSTTAYASCGSSYTVKRGDTVYAIGRLCGVRPSDIVKWNNLASPNKIYVGQVLVLQVNTAPQKTVAIKGLAMAMPQYQEDLAKLNVSWYYVWGWCDKPNCIPMVRSMQLPTSCPMYILVGNEPNAIEPYGAPITPNNAVNAVIAIQKQCPNSNLIVGNVSVDDWSSIGGYGSGYKWVSDFLAGYYWATKHNFNQTLGVHCYSQELASYCTKKLAEIKKLYRGDFWLTEFGLIKCSASEFSAYLDYAMANFSRVAPYTNRQPHLASNGWEIDSGVELVDGNGNLTTCGAVYASR